MNVTLVSNTVKIDHLQDFIAATRLNQGSSVREPGNLRFDFLQSVADSVRFLLYEVYASDDAAVRHKLTAHYLRWRDSVSEWMAQPRQGAPFQVLSPIDPTSGS